jgi:hypothetical protein
MISISFRLHFKTKIYLKTCVSNSLSARKFDFRDLSALPCTGLASIHHYLGGLLSPLVSSRLLMSACSSIARGRAQWVLVQRIHHQKHWTIDFDIFCPSYRGLQ